MPQEKRFERNPDFIFRKIVDETVLVPIHRDVANMDSIYTLNSIGAFIWEQLAQPATQNELQSTIQEVYEADPKVLTSDVKRFLSEMTAIGAIREV